MAIVKNIPNATVDLHLNDIATSTMVIYSSMTTNPTNAAAITGVLATRSGLTGANFTVTTGTSVLVQAGSSITAAATGTATCVILKTGVTSTDGVIKMIDSGSTVLTATQNYTPSAFTYTYNQPT
jgi:hypothetical protein